MEEAFRNGGMFDKPQTKSVKESHGIKREDVELIVSVIKISEENLLTYYLQGQGVRNSSSARRASVVGCKGRFEGSTISSYYS